MKETVLVVEDDAMIRNLLKIYLEKEQYDVVEAVDGKEAQEKYERDQPCVIILDRMMPRMSGEEFCKWLRHEKKSDATVIMLSAKAQTDDRIEGLDIGADNYVTKPFEPSEIVAYVKAGIRRSGSTCKKIASDELVLHPNRREVILRGKDVQLTKHEFDLLYCFMKNPQIVMTREQLIEQMYPYDERDVLDRTIDAHIKKLREKIEDIPSQPKRIVTVRGMGYKFVHEQA
ncbi:response regulator transcription factor [Savagea sp. SN6]|uniref:Response regulator transcription factor n=1 Tax=Savagea serpentis TaxID=2785297 RepID=A0A8J7GAJ1_9BACL|nr:response regulator transcription factor [Savagea serpentis]MBF4499821.1 response regulator transcription factor [Savagea serpentis]